VPGDNRLPKPIEEHWRWQMQAACRGLATTIFFHPDYERGDNRRRREAEAKAICRQCPVIEQCAQHALPVHEPYGIWGGLSVEERESMLCGQCHSTREAVDIEMQYAQGATIRTLAAATGRSYGFVRDALTAAQVTLRRRGR